MVSGEKSSQEVQLQQMPTQEREKSPVLINSLVVTPMNFESLLMYYSQVRQ